MPRGSVGPDAPDCVTYTVPWGDVTLDGAANIIDAQQIARFTVGLPVARLAAVQFAGDVTADTAVNIVDAQQIARWSVGLSAAARLGVTLEVPMTAASVTVGPSNPVVQVGDSLALTAVAFDAVGNAMGECASVIWASSDTTSVTVTDLGLVQARGPGNPVISALSGLVSSSATVTVTTSATVTGVVGGMDTTTVTVPSGALVSVPPGALPVGTVIKLADAGVDPSAGSNQVGSAVVLIVSAPAGAAMRASAVANVAPLPSTVTIPVAVARSTLLSSGLSAAFSFSVAGTTPSVLYTHDLTITAAADPLQSLVQLQLVGVPKQAVAISLRIDRVASPPECAIARQFRDPEPTNTTQAVDPTRIPLILIHGWQPTKEKCSDFDGWKPEGTGSWWKPGSAGTWSVLYPELTNLSNGLGKYQIWVMRYPTNRPIGEAAEYLKQKINARFAIQDVVIVAHSMGGVVAAKYLSDNSSTAHLGQLITLGTPYQGTVLADVIASREIGAGSCGAILSKISDLGLQWTPYPFSEGVADLSPSSLIYTGIRAAHSSWWSKTSIYTGDVTAIPWGDNPFNPYQWGDCVIVNSGDMSDGVVPYTSANDPTWGTPAQSVMFPKLNHGEMVTAPGPVGAVIARLKTILSLTPMPATEVPGTNVWNGFCIMSRYLDLSGSWSVKLSRNGRRPVGASLFESQQGEVNPLTCEFRGTFDPATYSAQLVAGDRLYVEITDANGHSVFASWTWDGHVATATLPSASTVMASDVSYGGSVIQANASLFYLLAPINYGGLEQALKRLPTAGGTARTLALHVANAPKLVTDGAYIYWMEGAYSSYSIKRVSVDSGAVETLVSGLSEPSSFGFVVDAGYVYFASAVPGDSPTVRRIRRVAVTGGAVVDIVATAVYPAFDVADGMLYYQDSDPAHTCSQDNWLGAISTIPVGGGARVPVAAGVTFACGGSTMRVAGNRLFVTHGTSLELLSSVPISGGALTLRATGLSGPSQLEADAGFLYVNTNGIVMKFDLNTFGKTILSWWQPAYGVAIDANYVYWTAPLRVYDNCCGGTWLSSIIRVPK